jgi:hypothetical protein
MLRRRGISTLLCFGVLKDGQGALALHAWLSAEGIEVTGYPVAENITPVACYSIVAPRQRRVTPAPRPGDAVAPWMNREFELVAACCQWPPSAQRNAALVAIAGGGSSGLPPVDWPRFVAVVRRHRVPGLVWNALRQAGVATPPNITAALRSYADRAVRESLRHAAEAIRVQRAFAQAGCRGAFLKGVTLALLAYRHAGVRHAGIRHAKDIDLIVPAEELAAACACLRAAGYRQVRPAAELSETQWALWRRYSKDIAWHHEARGIELELHWRLTEHWWLLPGLPDLPALQRIELNATDAVETLSAPDLFAYLCVHGATHAWCRLKWLADVNALIAEAPEELLEQYYRSAKAAGSHRAVGQALLLCAKIFALRLPTGVAAELQHSWVVRILARIALLGMTRGGAQTEIYDQRFGSTLIAASTLLLPTTFRSRVAAAWLMSLSMEDVLTLRLPRYGRAVYRVLRVPLWLIRRTVLAGASRRA